VSYTRGVKPSPLEAHSPTSAAVAPQRRRRHPTSGAAQAKRVEWGRKWGGVTSATAKRIRLERE